MDRADILRILQAQRVRLRDLGVQGLYLFGSYVRGENRPDSDVDLIVEFAEPVGLLRFVKILQELELALGRKVDLIDRRTLRGPLGDRILAESIHAA
jgi:predicted nucleotidyltransferase